jgi:tetratricopeptide (TPR) repeat protein
MNRFWGFFLLLLSVSSFAQRGGDVINIDDTVHTSYALVVGISNYLNINPLMYADDDADAFATWLIEQEICERKNVKRLIDSQATAANFYLELERFLNKAKANDRLYIYFAGHGDVENKIQAGFLLCYGTRPSPYAGSDVIDINMLENYVNAFTNNNTKVVLITDACRAGNLAGGLTGASNTLNSINTRFRNVIKMLSCQPNQLSQEKLYPGGGHGVFTYHLLNGLYGLADSNGDKKISLRELDKYLDAVTDETDEKQSPKIDGNPLVKLVGYNEALKQLAIAKSKNTAIATGKTNDRARNDTGWTENKYYQKFRQAIKDHYLVEYMGGSADFIISTAEMDNQPADMIADMKLELAAVLEDQLQKWLNNYMRGELDPKKNNCYECIIKMSDYANYLEKLTPKDHLRYKEIHVKKVFFDIYHNWSYRLQHEYINYINRLKEADKAVPNQAWIQHVIASFYDDLRQYDLAKTWYSKAISLAPKWSYPFINRGIVYLTEKNYRLAEQDFKTAFAYDPESAVAIFDLGLTYSRQGKYRESDSCYRIAIAIDSNYTPALTSLADNAIADSNYTVALDYLTKARNADSTEYSVYTTLAYLYEALKDTAKAKEAYENAVNVSPYDPYPWNLQGYYLYDLKLYKEAIEILEKSYRKDSLNVFVIEALGLSHLELKNFSAAAYWFKKMIALQKDSSRPVSHLAIVYIQQEKYKEGEAMIRQVIKMKPDYAWAWMNLGYIMQKQKRFKEAKKYYFKTIDLYRESYYVHYYLAEIAVMEKQADTAIANLVLSLQYNPGYQAASNLADSLFLNEKNIAIKMGRDKLEKKDFLSAEVYFTKLSQLYPEDPEILYAFASTLAGSGKSEYALETLRHSIAKGFTDVNRLKADKNFDGIPEVEAIRRSLQK